MNNKVLFRFSDISEHDMDMLFLEEFAASEKFLKLFTDKAKIETGRVISVELSKTEIGLGESDMTVIIEINNKKIGLLIEDKIDAIAMPDQCERYKQRGDVAVNRGDYSDYFVFIVAPEKYLKENAEAGKYDHKIEYETIKQYFEEKDDDRSYFKYQQLCWAIEKQKKGYQVIVNEAVTDFWKKYSDYQKEYYPGLYLLYSGEDKGSQAFWPRFNTVIKGLYMYHKTEFGVIDLTFDNAATKLLLIENLLSDVEKEYLKEGYTVQATSKSGAIRLLVPIIDVRQPFDDQLVKIEKCFEAIQKMSDLVKKLDAELVSRIKE